MLQLKIVTSESWNEETEEFLEEFTVLELEHSLVSVSKWESKWCKPFLSAKTMTAEETIYYVKCMTLNGPIDPNVYNHLTNNHIKQVREYMEAPMTATWFREENNQKTNREQITSELIYYWMTALNIDISCERWHLTRLLTLIKVCSIKSQPGKKMSQRDITSQNAAINAARRKQFNTRG